MPSCYDPPANRHPNSIRQFFRIGKTVLPGNPFTFTPVVRSLDSPISPSRQGILLRSLVDVSFVNKSILGQHVEIGIQPSVIDLISRIVFQLVLDGETLRILQSADGVEDAALETGQVNVFLVITLASDIPVNAGFSWDCRVSPGCEGD